MLFITAGLCFHSSSFTKKSFRSSAAVSENMLVMIMQSMLFALESISSLEGENHPDWSANTFFPPARPISSSTAVPLPDTYALVKPVSTYVTYITVGLSRPSTAL